MENRVEKGLSITKSNALVESAYRLSLTEMQIVLYGISLINPIQKTFPLTYRIDINRFSEIFNRSHKDIYTEVKDAVIKRFWERDFSYIDDKGKTVTLRWLTKIVHEDKSGYLEIKFSEEIQPYLHELHNNFTKYYISEIAKFKRIYSIRFYEYSIMLLNKNETNKFKFCLSINDLKRRLCLEDKYTRFSNFKSRVLDSSKKEINNLSDINLNYKLIKLGRNPYQIEFTVERKNKNSNLDLKQKEISDVKISKTVLEKVKKIASESQTGWDLISIEKQFYEYIRKYGYPKNIDAAFIGFTKKKVLNEP